MRLLRLEVNAVPFFQKISVVSNIDFHDSLEDVDELLTCMRQRLHIVRQPWFELDFEKRHFGVADPSVEAVDSGPPIALL